MLERLRSERAIGYNLERIMGNQQVTEKQLACQLQVSELYIKSIVTGSVNVQESVLESMAEALGVDKQELLQPVLDENLQEYNVHCMGTANNAEDMNEILNKVDMYVRLLNAQSKN